LAVVLVFACTAELPSSVLVRAVHAYFAERGIEPDAIACPKGVHKEIGQAVVCDVTIDSQPIPVVVEVSDDQGGLSLRPAHATLVTTRVEAEIAETLRGQGYAVAEIRCEGQVWVVGPGAEHHCEVLVDDGGRYAWRGVFNGRGAEHRVQVVPFDEPGGEAS